MMIIDYIIMIFDIITIKSITFCDEKFYKNEITSCFLTKKLEC